MKLYWRYKKDGKWTWKAAKVGPYSYPGSIDLPINATLHWKEEEE